MQHPAQNDISDTCQRGYAERAQLTKKTAEL